MTSFRVRSILTASLAAGIWVAYTQQQPPPELTVTKVHDDLHVIVGSGGNVTVYETPEGVVLVDDKFEPNVPQILAKTKSVTSKPIRYLLNTHQHGDHTGGNAKLMEQGVEIIAHENARLNMEERKMPGLPRLSFANQFTVRLGGKTIRAQHFGRGHTNGDAVIYFPARKTIHMGDMFVSSAPFVDYANGGSGVEWPRTLDRVLTLDFDTVIPGHGPILRRADLVKWKQGWEQFREELLSKKRSGMAKDEIGKGLNVDPFFGTGGKWERSFSAFWDEVK